MATLVLSADGRRVATTSTDGGVVWDADTGKPLLGEPVSPAISSFNCPASMNRDGSFVVFSQGDTPVIWNVDSRKRIDLVRRHFGGETTCFSPDGKRLIIGAFKGKDFASVLSVESLNEPKPGANPR